MEAYLIIALLIVLIILIFVLIMMQLINKKSDANEHLRTSFNNDLANFLKNINQNLNYLNDSTGKKLNVLEEKINKNLTDSFKTSNDYFLKLNEKIVKIDEAQKGLNDLSDNILSLNNILIDKKNRGTFGEIELYSLLESSLGVNSARWARQYTLKNGLKCDAIIFGGERLGNIVIDSKFPLENYRRIYDFSLSKEDNLKARRQFKADVLKHINDIKNKYIIPGFTSEMAYMFIPAEAVYAEIYGNYQEIVDASYKAKVYIVSPTTLMAYITAIRSIYLGQTKDLKAKEIEKLLNELSIEFTRLKDRGETLQRDFEKIIPDFENMFITEQKIIKKFAKLNSGDLLDEKEDR